MEKLAADSLRLRVIVDAACWIVKVLEVTFQFPEVSLAWTV